MAKENFTTYEETDPNTRITKTTDRVSYVNLSRAEDAYVYKDKGVDHFDGDFEHLITIYNDASTYKSVVAIWALANLVDDFAGISAANGDELAVVQQVYENSVRINFREYIEGAFYNTTWTGANLDTPYYLRIKRDEAVGTYGTLYCYIYSDAARTNLLATLTLTLHGKKDFRYIYVCQTGNDALSDRYQTGYCENLYLEPPPPFDAILKRYTGAAFEKAKLKRYDGATFKGQADEQLKYYDGATFKTIDAGG